MIVFSSCSFAQTPLSSLSNSFYSKVGSLARNEDECLVLVVDDAPDIAVMLACFLDKPVIEFDPCFRLAMRLMQHGANASTSSFQT
jgi:hypothetical protein